VLFSLGLCIEVLTNSLKVVQEIGVGDVIKKGNIYRVG